MTVKGQRSSRDLPYLNDDATLSDVINLLNDLIAEMNYLSKNISLQSNFDCQILDVKFAAGESKTIPHKLGILPKFRIILRQQGNGVLTDIPSGWNNFNISIKNEGAVEVTATIMLLRE